MTNTSYLWFRLYWKNLFDILNVTELTGINLTEILATLPTASFSEWLLSPLRS